MSATQLPPVIWRVLDGRAGHCNQVLGLTDALERRIDVDCHDVLIDGRLKGLRCLIPGRLNCLRQLPRPNLLIGAGHSVHLPLLCLRHAFGGRSIVLMKPSIPMAAFDLSIIASVHNLRRVRSNVITTAGPLNRMQPSRRLQDSEGLILIGGVSDHFRWSDRDVLDQLSAVVTSDTKTSWTLTTSRRTPPSFLDAWQSAGLPGRMVPCEDTPAGWMQEMLQRAGRVWVTCESMSMVYEALTAGAAVGLLELAPVRRGRVYRSSRELIDSGHVTPWSAWRDGTPLRKMTRPLREADRCADEVILRFLAASALNAPAPIGRAS